MIRIAMGIAMRAMIGLIFVLFVTTNLYPSDGSDGSEDRYEVDPIPSLLKTSIESMYFTKTINITESRGVIQ